VERPLEIGTEHQPFVILMVGVNGAGKTTTIGKLARRFQDQGLSVMLVLDASQGQNALVQAQKFNDALGLTGITVTKLDGSAKGGILLAVANELQVPVRFIGIGESAEDMQPFVAEEFADALLGSGEQG
jgi:fused signal recognition particle receptor